MTPTAAATDSLLPDESAVERLSSSSTALSVDACCSSSPTPASFCLSEPADNSSVIAVSTSGLAASSCAVPSSSAAAAPDALAIADNVELDAPAAANVTVPVAFTLRAVVASAVSSTRASARAAPMAALEPAAAPEALVIVVEVCMAETLTLPLEVWVEPVPKRAMVVLLIIDRPSAGVIETPPAEPASASVVAEWMAVAARVRSATPVMVAPSATSAVERFARILSATEAPMPTVSPVAPPPTGLASAVESVWLSASRLTEPPPVIATVEPAATMATLCVSIRFRATEPAMPTSPAPAPEVALAR